MADLRRQSVQEADEISIDLVDLFVRFVSKWRTGLVAAVVTFAICLVFILRIKPLFEASSSILPSQAPAETSSLSAIFSGKRPGDLYVGLLRSRTVEDNVISRVGLLETYKTLSHEAARATLAANTRVFVGADSLVMLTVRDESASTAMRIANAYVDALEDQQQAMTLQQAGQRLEIFAKQLRQEKDALNVAEQELRKLQESTGIVQIQDQSQIGLSSIANLRSQIAALQVQLSSLLLSSTEQNPQVRILRSQIAQLQSEERSLETGSQVGAPGSPITARRIPEAKLQEVRLQREVKYHETLFNLLSSQLENVRLTAESSKGAFQVVDRATLPEFRAWPPRRSLVVGAVFGAFLVGMVAIGIHLLFLRLVADPENLSKLKSLGREPHLVQH